LLLRCTSLPVDDGDWVLLADALAQRVHHCGNSFFPRLRSLRAFDLAYVFLLMSKREPGPVLFGFGIASNNLLEVDGHYNSTLVFVEGHQDSDSVSRLALGAGAH